MSKQGPSTRLLLVLVLLAGAVSPLSARPIRLRVGTLAPQGSPWHDALLQMKSDWHRISGGQIELVIYSGVLGDETQMIRKLAIGQLQLVGLSGSALPRIEPGVNALQIPLLLDSYAELDYVRERLAPRLEAELEARGDYQILSWSDAGWVHFFTSQPARTLDDLRRLKLLTSAGDPDIEELYKDFGFKVVPLPYTEVLMALETGLIEAVSGPPLYAMLDQWFGLADHMTQVRWAPLVGAVVIRQDTWKRLPDELKPQLLDAARAAMCQLQDDVRQLGEQAVPEMQKRGLEVVQVEGPLLAEWRREADRSYSKLRGRYVSDELMDEVLRLREQYRRCVALEREISELSLRLDELRAEHSRLECDAAGCRAGDGE